MPGARSELTLGKNLATAHSVIEGTHPEVAIMDSVAQGKLGDFTPQQRELAERYSIAIRQAAAKYIELNGYKAPTAKIVERPVFPVEKTIGGRVVGEGNPQITSSSPIVPTHEFPLSSPTLPDYLDPNRTYAGRNSPAHSATKNDTGLYQGGYPGDAQTSEDHSIQPAHSGLDGVERGISVAGAAAGRGGSPQENAGPYEPTTAERRALELIHLLQEHNPWLADVAILSQTIPSGAPMKVRSGGSEWVYDKVAIARELNLLHAKGLDELRWLRSLVSEEFIHVPQLLLAGSNIEAKYSALLETLPIPLRGIIGLTYYGGRDAENELPADTRMIEYERMVIQYRETGTTTEELLGRDISAIKRYLAGPQPQAVEDNIDLVLALRNAGPEADAHTPPPTSMSTTRQQILETVEKVTANGHE